MVGICGGSSSGKSFITKWLKDKFTEISMSVTILKEKNFLIPIEGDEEKKDPEELLLSHDFDNYEAIDWPLFEDTVSKLKNRQSAATPIYDIFDNKRLLRTKE